jgi:hypothetical protein
VAYGAQPAERFAGRHVIRGREHHEGHVADGRELADVAAGHRAGPAVQREIEDDHIRRDLLDPTYGVALPVRLVHGEAGTEEMGPERRGDDRIVLHEHRCARYLHSHLPPLRYNAAAALTTLNQD